MTYTVMHGNTKLKLIHYSHGIVNPKIQDFDLPQTHTLIPTIQLFATGSNGPVFRHVTSSHLLPQETLTALSSSVFHSLCLSVFVSCALQNETLFLSLKYFVLLKTVCILQKPIRLVMLLRSFYTVIPRLTSDPANEFFG